jgi:hypothetical protein
MTKNSTLMYLFDNLYYPNGKIVKIEDVLNDIETSLDEIFNGLEIEASAELVSRTMAMVENKG